VVGLVGRCQGAPSSADDVAVLVTLHVPVSGDGVWTVTREEELARCAWGFPSREETDLE
jgi:hypothetical protein